MSLFLVFIMIKSLPVLLSFLTLTSVAGLAKAFIADMNALPDPGTDTVAAVGIGGLIAAKVAANTGILVVLLAFPKKGFVLLLPPLFRLKNLFFKPKKPDSEA